MIGIKVRGAHHLWRLCDASINKILVNIACHGYEIASVIKTSKDCSIGERLFILNSAINNNSNGHILSSIGYDAELFRHKRIIEIQKEHISFFNDYFNDIILLPKSFDDDYAHFLKQNGKAFNNLFNRYSITNVNDIYLKRLFIYTNGSKNFFAWAVDVFYGRRCSMWAINNILTWNEFYSQLTNKLSKGTITAYKTKDAIEKLLSELKALRNEKRINDAINSFNTTQKKMLKSNELTDRDKETLVRFSKLSEIKRINFIKKVSTIDDFNELMRLMRLTASVHFEWNKESFMDYIKNVEGLKFETIFESETVILVKVLDFETIKQLGKTTNWCISKNKQYWNNYIEHNCNNCEQYVLFDFSKIEDDKLSIVGFTTTKNKGITSAHNFVNDSIMGGNITNVRSINSFLSKFNLPKGIYGILENCGIDINLVINYKNSTYKWDCESLLSYLYECVDKDNVTIIKNDNNKLVLSVVDENIRYFLGDEYIDTFERENWDNKHIIFADFNKNQCDPDRFWFGIVFENGDEECCNSLYNASLNTTVSLNEALTMFDVPYDIIKRPNDKDKIIYEAFLTFNVPLIKRYVKNDKNALHNSLMNHLSDEECLFNAFWASIIDYSSFDYLNLLYDNGHMMTEYLGEYPFSEIIRALFGKLKFASERLNSANVFKNPSDEEIKSFYEGKINSEFEAMYVGFFLILKTIIENENMPKETAAHAYKKLLYVIMLNKTKGDGIKKLLFLLLNKIDLKRKTDGGRFLVKCFLQSKDNEMLDTVKSLSEKYSWITQLCTEAMETANSSNNRFGIGEFLEF